MKPVGTMGRAMLALAVAALLVPTSVAAQLSNPALDRQHEAAIAVAYGGAPGAIEKAVLLHAQVVHKRMANDARRSECLRSHANLLYYYGRLEGARLYMEAAAEQAAFEGHDYDAAMTYIDAAILAKKAGDYGAVMKLASQADVISSSARLDPEQRAAIRTRIGQ